MNATATAGGITVLFGTVAAETFVSSVGTSPRAYRVFESCPTARPRDLARIIENIRATPGGNAAWRLAEHQKREARREAMMLRRMNRIKYYRIERGMTQQELAVAIRSKQSDVSRFEKEGYRPNTRTLERVAQALNVTVADLL